MGGWDVNKHGVSQVRGSSVAVLTLLFVSPAWDRWPFNLFWFFYLRMWLNFMDCIYTWLRSEHIASQTTSRCVLSDSMHIQPCINMRSPLSGLDIQIQIAFWGGGGFFIFTGQLIVEKQTGNKGGRKAKKVPARINLRTLRLLGLNHTKMPGVNGVFPYWAALVPSSRPWHLLSETQVWQTIYVQCPCVFSMSSVQFYFCGCHPNKEQPLCLAWPVLTLINRQSGLLEQNLFHLTV